MFSRQHLECFHVNTSRVLANTFCFLVSTSSTSVATTTCIFESVYLPHRNCYFSFFSASTSDAAVKCVSVHFVLSLAEAGRA